jgi:hypothetical protein
MNIVHIELIYGPFLAKSAKIEVFAVQVTHLNDDLHVLEVIFVGNKYKICVFKNTTYKTMENVMAEVLVLRSLKL